MIEGTKVYIHSKQNNGGLQNHICKKCIHRVTKGNMPYTVIEAKGLTIYVWRNVTVEINQSFVISKLYYIQPISFDFNGKDYLKVILSGDIRVVGKEDIDSEPNPDFVDDGDDYPF